MRRIVKTEAPESVKKWKRKNPKKRYRDLPPDGSVRKDIRKACIEEQFYLCAYCCRNIDEDNAINEHLEPQHRAPNKTLDYDNIVASCTTPKQCDDAHGSKPLPITPLMEECETDLQYKLSGRVEGLTPQAIETIKVLNLGDSRRNNESIISKRTRLFNDYIWTKIGNPEDGCEDPKLLQNLIRDLSTPQDGKLEPFAPAIANFLSSWIDQS